MNLFHLNPRQWKVKKEFTITEQDVNEYLMNEFCGDECTIEDLDEDELSNILEEIAYEFGEGSDYKFEELFED